MTKVNVTKDGPYLLSDLTEIRRMPDGRAYEVSGTAALCRCGASKNKPFCDGTHKRNGFSGAKAANRVPNVRDHYAAAGITVHDNRGLCAHSGKCTDGLPAVFRLREEPFVDPAAKPPSDIANTIRQCPSGALSYSIDGDEKSERGGAPAVAFVPNGPYVIRGGAELKGAELLDGATTDHFALCRCGHSKNKPFCSGAHWTVQFDEDAGKGGAE